MSVRLPRRPGSGAQVEKDLRWLPRFAPLLPVDVPVPPGRGEPTEFFPRPWSVHRWLDGENPSADHLRHSPGTRSARSSPTTNTRGPGVGPRGHRVGVQGVTAVRTVLIASGRHRTVHPLPGRSAARWARTAWS
ncbi:phosphotransferase [Streptosporangium sandarakinum]|uniref:phosphotransferase n=1 Tax=Streptosporangium sandarakinum TaxID=1260955 RepID=UPI0035E43974